MPYRLNPGETAAPEDMVTLMSNANPGATNAVAQPVSMTRDDGPAGPVAPRPTHPFGNMREQQTQRAAASLAPDVNPHAEEAAEARQRDYNRRQASEGFAPYINPHAEEAREARQREYNQRQTGEGIAPYINPHAEAAEENRTPGAKAKDSDPADDGAENDATVTDWKPVQSFVTKGKTFETNGPIRIEMNSMSLFLDGMRYTVDWHPLDKNGNRQTIVRSGDYRVPEYGGNLFTGVPSETIIEPPYDHPYGFEVTVSVPPQAWYNESSAGPYLNIYQSK